MFAPASIKTKTFVSVGSTAAIPGRSIPGKVRSLIVPAATAAPVVSAGHTGAAVAAGTIKLRTLPGIDRPGIVAVLPTEMDGFALIDASANIDARRELCLQFA